MLEPGRMLLHYRLAEKIGEGGMGVVWKALDTSLGREVAIKVLPPGFAADAERVARFDREARLLASLSHPHIAGIFGVHQAESLQFLAMELVGGEDLAQRIERGPLEIREALRLAREVAAALEAAHDSGVIHRDLKPANVRLTLDGKAKVLDFGLAKASAGTPAADVTRSPTLTSAGTMAGMILGTASYMSPEQAAGLPADRRCDIWSFGVMLYEMLTGRRLFAGETISHTLADVLRASIDLSDLPADVPSPVRRLLERCLERDPLRRLRDIGEARIVLEDALDRPEAQATVAPQAVVAGRSRWPWLLAGLGWAAAGALALVAWSWTGRDEPLPTWRFLLAMPSSGNLRSGDGVSITISPDGRTVATRGGAGTDDLLYLRGLDDFEARPLPGTAGATGPEFSPDGQWIAFVTAGGLHKVRISGGAPVMLAPLQASAALIGYHWASDHHIYHGSEGELWRVPDSGGVAERITTGERLEGRGFSEPFAVPEAGVLLANTTAPNRLVAIDLQGGGVKDLEMAGRDPRYLPTGHLLFRQDDKVVAAAFDLAAREFRGSPVPVLPRATSDVSSMQVAVSHNGTVAYLPQRPGETQSVVYVDPSGKIQPVVPSGLPFPTVNDPRISPDGRYLAVSVGNQAIWIIDLETQTPTLLTDDGFYPLWSPDGREILFSSTRGKTFDIYRVPVDLRHPEVLALDADNNMRTMDWTARDGIVLREEVPDKGMDLRRWTDPDDPEALESLLEGADDELAPTVSRDGRFMAYVSNHSGSDEVYVTSFPTAGGRVQISNRGGHSPTWAPDGKRLYYLEGLKMIAATLGTEPSVRVLGREVLFEGEFVQYRWSRQYDITPDGKRFVMIKNPPGGHIEVITNWFPELEQLTSSAR